RGHGDAAGRGPLRLPRPDRSARRAAAGTGGGGGAPALSAPAAPPTPGRCTDRPGCAPAPGCPHPAPTSHRPPVPRSGDPARARRLGWPAPARRWAGSPGPRRAPPTARLGRRLPSMPDLHDQIPTREKVLIIGAGPAGLAAAAALKALEVPFDLVDQAAHVGGIWDPEREDSPVWPTMEMISSREFTQYEDMLQPVSFPEYLSPTQMAKYLRAYAARHDLTEHFRPRTAVRS